jgi:hypothetical protein
MGLKEEEAAVSKKAKEIKLDEYEMDGADGKKIKLVKINFKNVVLTEQMIKYNSMYNKENKIYEEVDKKLLSK